jgi:uncharacterized membrane protein YdbT with pleckstrin-like domain
VSIYVNRHLLPNEVQIATVRQHVFNILPALAAAGGAILAAIFVGATYGGEHGGSWVAWLLALLLVIRAAFASAAWWVRYMVLTSDRFMLFSGLLDRRVKVIPYSALMEMSFSRTFAGRVFGFGTFTVEAGGKPMIVLDYIPFSEQMLLLLSGQLYPQSLEEDDDDASASDAL